MARNFQYRHLTPLVLVVGVGIFAPCRAAADCTGFQWTAQGPSDQLVALQEFFQATQGHQWLSQSGWNTSASANACSWSGITCCNTTVPVDPDQQACTYDGAVQFVTLPNNNLSGEIPASFWARLGCTLSGVSLAGDFLSTFIPILSWQLSMLCQTCNLAIPQVSVSSIAGALQSLDHRTWEWIHCVQSEIISCFRPLIA